VFEGEDAVKLHEKLSRVSPLCALCRGTRGLCGLGYCPILSKYYSLKSAASALKETQLQAQTPPGVFVGRIGYPRVFAGPLFSTSAEDPYLYDTPELWGSIGLDSLIRMRSALIRGKNPTRVDETSGMIQQLQEIALSKTPAEVEIQLAKQPSGLITFDENAQPMGPSVELLKLRVVSSRSDRTVESVVSDDDMRSDEAMFKLYGDGLLVSRIQKILSVGLLGEKKERKVVPTRWSITAVDDVLSKKLLEKVKYFPELNEYLLYRHDSLDNAYLVLLLPGKWEYELVEAWYPGTVWNAFGQTIAIYSSYEAFRGRKTYAEIGGCYYSGRLSVAEALYGMRRQARALILREAREGYVLPVGVWHVRESVRKALSTSPEVYSSLEEILQAIGRNSTVPVKDWVAKSILLEEALRRRSILEFLT